MLFFSQRAAERQGKGKRCTTFWSKKGPRSQHDPRIVKRQAEPRHICHSTERRIAIVASAMRVSVGEEDADREEVTVTEEVTILGVFGSLVSVVLNERGSH